MTQIDILKKDVERLHKVYNEEKSLVDKNLEFINSKIDANSREFEMYKEAGEDDEEIAKERRQLMSMKKQQQENRALTALENSLRNTVISHLPAVLECTSEDVKQYYMHIVEEVLGLSESEIQKYKRAQQDAQAAVKNVDAKVPYKEIKKVKYAIKHNGDKVPVDGSVFCIRVGRKEPPMPGNVFLAVRKNREEDVNNSQAKGLGSKGGVKGGKKGSLNRNIFGLGQ